LAIGITPKRKNPCQELIGISFLATSGTSHTDAIKKEFLLKFTHDRRRVIHWRDQARRRFGVKILRDSA
jgi:hypothetical protein